MISVKLRYLTVLAILLAIFVRGSTREGPPQEKDGTLSVFVMWGDMDNTPATNVYVEAHGFVSKYGSTKSFILKMSRVGRYEASLPPGVYDVFVSEGTSEPRCRRIMIRSGLTSHWTLKLELDEIFTEK